MPFGSVKIEFFLGFFPRDQRFPGVHDDGFFQVVEVFDALDAFTQYLQLSVNLFQGERLGRVYCGGVTYTSPFSP